MLNPTDQEQRLAALNPAKSFIVQAPAGSGKTALLTQRYLALLAHAKAPEEIIAITFTRKAAAEMRNRILTALENGQGDQEKIAQWRLLENPNRLRIQTIDALCASLTRQMPVLSRFGAQPDIADNPEKLYLLAARNVLASLENNTAWQQPLTDLLLHLDNDQNKVEKLFGMMLARRDQWLPHVLNNNSAQRELLEKNLQQAITDSLIKLKNSIPVEIIEELLTLLRFAKNPVLAQLPNTELADISSWLEIANFLLTQKGEWRKKADANLGFPAPSASKNSEEKKLFTEMKACFAELLQTLNSQEELRQNLQDVTLLPPAVYTNQQWKIIIALLELLPVLVAELQLVFQEHNAVDYLAITNSALIALGDSENPTDLALRLDYKIQHILVDEFQDTSVTQWRLLEHLVAGWQPDDGRTLFLVGDPMQSIYRFRKAEVGLFLQARKYGIGAIRLEPLTLQVNFRSTSEIVEWTNKVFKELLPEQEDINTGAVTFNSSVANISVGATGGRPVNNIFTNITGNEPEKIVQIIQKIQSNNPEHSIAVLVRARSHLTEILPALQKAQINYRAVEIENLSNRPVIYDLLALTRALLHPADRIAWLAILRAPWCGLTLQELHSLAGQQADAILWDRLQRIDDVLPHSENYQRLKYVVEVLAQSLKQRRRQAVATWVENTWQALGGPACVLSENDLNDAQAFFKLLNQLEVGGDIPDLNNLEEQLTTLYSKSTAQANCRIEVMTIHKAKGLEFDNVILPGLNHTPANDEQQLLLTLERPTSHGSTDLLLAPIKASEDERDAIYAYLRSEEKKRADYETVRLLYVAVTRAKQSLYLLAHLTDENSAPAKNSLLGKLWPVMSNDFYINKIVGQAVAQQLPDNTPQLLRRLTKDWQLPNPLPLDPSSQKNPKQQTILPWNNDPARHIGTVTHRLLQQIYLDGVENWNEAKIQTHNPFIQNLLIQTGINKNHLADSSAQVTQALIHTIHDPRGRWILSKQHQASMVEYPLVAVINNQATHIIIDRTFIDQQNTRWIIDYKTSSEQDTNPEQYREQLELYAKIMQMTETYPIKLGIYFPLLSKWHEWSFV